MTKRAEVDYVSKITEGERIHAAAKPFSDPHRGRYLQQFGTILALLPEPPARVLDMGCGTGWTTEFLDRSGYDVVGVDIAPDMIDLARSVPARRDIHFVVSDYEGLAGLGAFDAVVFFDCLHHAEDERAALTAAYRALSPGGRVVLSEPGAGHHQRPESRRAMDEFGVNEKDMPPSHIIELATAVGFRDWEVYPDPGTLLSFFVRHLGEQGTDHRRPVWLKRAAAFPVIKALGGSSSAFADDLDNFAFLTMLQHLLDGLEQQDGITVLHR